MFVVAVRFEIHPEHAEAFAARVVRQAQDSKKNEPDCHQFDVARDLEDPALFFLYELYTDAAAFEVHRQTEYFVDFFRTVEPMIKERRLMTLERIEPA